MLEAGYSGCHFRKMNVNAININNALLNSLHGLPALASASAPAGGGTLAADDFASVLRSMLVGVSQSQQHATRLAESFEMGQHQDLAGVMIDQQKAKLAFQTTLQVRNKMVSAYQDIMNMPV